MSDAPARSPGEPACVRYERRGRIAVITIDRPSARNAVDGAVAAGIEWSLDQAESDAGVLAIVLTGAPPVFCAGADLKEIGAGREATLSTERGGFAGIVRRERTKTLIAAVDGPALAGGTEIVLACDLVVASEAAEFGIPEVRRGLVAAAGGLFRLGRVLPRAIAMELALTGRGLPATEAYRHGFVNRLCAPGDAAREAMALAEVIAANAPIAVSESRAVILATMGVSDDEGWRRTDAARETVMATEDLREGVAAFIERREPRWEGR